MNIYVTYAIIFMLLLVFELLYFNIAEKFNIVDKPNKRSSHSTIVLRGGVSSLRFRHWFGLACRLLMAIGM